MIEVIDLVKRYGSHLAVDRVSFCAASGEVLGLLGPNGAGKSTILRVLAGYLTPTGGTARVADLDVQTASLEVRRRLGYLTDSCGLYGELRISEYLAYRATLKGLSGAARRRRIAAVLETCALGDVRDRIVGQLSKGYRQRVSLAAALLADPPVLVLDEPTVGLDPIQVREFRALVRSLGRDRTVLFSTHILTEAEAVCGRVVILDRGRVLADGAPAELASRFRAQVVQVELLGDPAVAVVALQAEGFAPVLEAEGPPAVLAIGGPGAGDPEVRARIARALAAAGCVVIGLAVRGGSLDEVFARVTIEAAA